MMQPEDTREDIVFSRHPVATIEIPSWERIVALNQAAVEAVYGDEFLRSQAIQESIGVHDIDRYIHARLIPNSQVGTVYRAGNAYRDPMITMATHRDGTIVSVAYTAHNTSGDTEAIRQAKMEARIPLKRWAWIGWLATDPEYQGLGLSTATVGHALRGYHPLQPTSAYAWVNNVGNDIPALGVLKRNGMKRAGESFTGDIEGLGLQRFTGHVLTAQARSQWRQLRPKR